LSSMVATSNQDGDCSMVQLELWRKSCTRKEKAQTMVTFLSLWQATPPNNIIEDHHGTNTIPK
jgi:hypothetical protein